MSKRQWLSSSRRPIRNKLEADVWERYGKDPTQLHEVVNAIKGHTHEKGVWHQPVEDEDEAGANEGKLLYRAHRTRERCPKIVKRKKEQALKRDDRLICEICGFDSQRQYAALDKPFIECHHIIPLPKLRPGQPTRLADLALVCANCHRALHRMPDPSDLAGLRRSLKQTY